MKNLDGGQLQASVLAYMAVVFSCVCRGLSTMAYMFSASNSYFLIEYLSRHQEFITFLTLLSHNI